MPELNLKPAAQCRYDAVSFGEVMLRLDPGEGRIRTSRTFQAWEGGGEYNVCRSLVSAFGLRGAIVTALADNEIGRLVEGLIRQGGVSTELIRWAPYDGLGRQVRNGLNFTERGFGVRGALGVSDRGHTAVSQLRPGDVDWDHLFGDLGVRWLHTGGISAGLGEETDQVVLEAVKAAHQYGTVVSYDVNYRPSIWRQAGGPAAATKVNRTIAPYIDVLIGLGLDIYEGPGSPVAPGVAGHRAVLEETARAYPHLKVVATTMRTVESATVNGWGALAWSPSRGVVQSDFYDRLEVMDRVGGGDSFASGLIYGLMQGHTLQDSLNYGVAHGALAVTTPGDNSMVTKAEILALADGGGSAVDR